MKILFDHQVFAFQKYGGVSRYFYELKNALKNELKQDARIFAPIHVNEYLRFGQTEGLCSWYMPYPSKGLRHRTRLLQGPLDWAIKMQKPDILHETHYTLTYRKKKPNQSMRIVSTVHDMIFEKFPEMIGDSDGRRKLKLESLNNADKIICISYKTKSDLLDFYPQFEEKVSVVHHGVSYVKPRDIAPDTLQDPYLLYVGTRAGNKNFSNFIKAIGSSEFIKTNFSLVLFGGGELKAEEKCLLADAGYSDKNLFHISGNDELLATAYKYATAFIFPSMYEGFGMPLTEAMQQGCPIICSNASCFPEICEEAAAYFEPDNLESMRYVMETTLGNSARLSELSKVGKLKSKNFTWLECATKTLAAYKN